MPGHLGAQLAAVMPISESSGIGADAIFTAPSSFTLFTFGGYSAYVVNGTFRATAPNGQSASFTSPVGSLPEMMGKYITVTISPSTGFSVYISKRMYVTFPLLTWQPGYASQSNLLYCKNLAAGGSSASPSGSSSEAFVTGASQGTLIYTDIQFYDYALSAAQVAAIDRGSPC